MRQMEVLRQQLSDRDIHIVEDIERFRLLTTSQIRRLYFTTGHQTVAAGTRACTRVLQRLHGHGLISALTRRVGGVRQGSDSLTWQLAATGDRFLRHLHHRPYRRRYREPSLMFIKHTLAVANLGVLLREAGRRGSIELVDLTVEGRAHRSFVGAGGAKETLKPDLHAVTATDDFEQHWMIEADCGTEHDPHLGRKLTAYHRYYNTGRYQAEHGLFPSVLWVVPDCARADRLRELMSATETPANLFQICTYAEFADFVVAKTVGTESLPLPGILEATIDMNVLAEKQPAPMRDRPCPQM
ncbi:replication-relaxation family protein [Nocardia amikacinitolerans]|uniref:replication-relaxation family protein n=1 Tax=Nocardia amikacinitolerans TaxID=756689 RepID=UPI0020A30C91|nr:replication-relaxation family protein [Nocardia amikacinitolerans]MCP2290945.1 Replication-relaxation [Nocardia amikacinitolerans]